MRYDRTARTAAGAPAPVKTVDGRTVVVVELPKTIRERAVQAALRVAKATRNLTNRAFKRTK